MKFSLFRSGWGPRVGAAVAYAVLAFGAVGLVTHSDGPGTNGGPAVNAEAAATARLVAVRLTVESVQPVSRWTVRNAGVVVEPQWTEANMWEGVLQCSVLDLSIVTTGELGRGANALRVRLESDFRHADFTFWCPGDCAVALGPNDFPLTASEDRTP